MKMMLFWRPRTICTK